MKSIILGIIPLVVLAPTLVYATNESPFEYGYHGGIADGKKSALDWGDVCDGFNSTATDMCINGYHLGFKVGCDNHDVMAGVENPEYPTCSDYLNKTK